MCIVYGISKLTPSVNKKEGKKEKTESHPALPLCPFPLYTSFWFSFSPKSPNTRNQNIKTASLSAVVVVVVVVAVVVVF